MKNCSQDSFNHSHRCWQNTAVSHHTHIPTYTHTHMQTSYACIWLRCVICMHVTQMHVRRYAWQDTHALIQGDRHTPCFTWDDRHRHIGLPLPAVHSCFRPSFSCRGRVYGARPCPCPPFPCLQLSLSLLPLHRLLVPPSLHLCPRLFI